jgi:hypothetical protein
VFVAAECKAQQIVDVVDAEAQPTRAAGAAAPVPASGSRLRGVPLRVYGRVLAHGLTYLDHAIPADLAKRHPLATAWRTLNHERFITTGPAAA